MQGGWSLVRAPSFVSLLFFSAPTAGQGLWVLVFAGACQGTAWAGLCLIHHHHHLPSFFFFLFFCNCFLQHEHQRAPRKEYFRGRWSFGWVVNFNNAHHRSYGGGCKRRTGVRGCDRTTGRRVRCALQTKRSNNKNSQLAEAPRPVLGAPVKAKNATGPSRTVAYLSPRHPRLQLASSAPGLPALRSMARLSPVGSLRHWRYSHRRSLR